MKAGRNMEIIRIANQQYKSGDNLNLLVEGVSFAMDNSLRMVQERMRPLHRFSYLSLKTSRIFMKYDDAGTGNTAIGIPQMLPSARRWIDLRQ